MFWLDPSDNLDGLSAQEVTGKQVMVPALRLVIVY